MVGALVLSADETALYAPLTDDGAVIRYEIASGAVGRLELPGAPTRLARHDGRLLVSLRAERSIAALEEVDGALVVAEHIEVGAEPVGIAVRGDGERVYVALSTEQAVVELDHELRPLRRLPISGNPEWVTLHPSGERLYVGTVTSGVSSFDLAVDEPLAEPILLPDIMGMVKRVTGDMAVSPDGRRLALPAVWQDVLRPPKHTDEEAALIDPAVKYEEIGLGLTANNPAVVLYDLDAHGLPAEEGVALYAVGEAITVAGEAPRPVRSILTNVTWAPDGETVLAAMEGSRVVAAVDADPAHFAPFVSGLLTAPLTFIGTGHQGVSGIAFLGGQRAFALHWLDRTLSELDYPSARAELDLQREGAAPMPLFDGRAVSLGASTLDPVVEEGRLLFHAAVNPVMSTSLSGVSCSTCHAGGRTSGINTMERDLIPRQVPSFAGPVSGTAPFTWNNDIASIPDEIMITSQIRLGGRGITEAQLAALEAYIDFIPDADTPEKGSRSPAVLRGEALFNRQDVGCAGCHSGPRFTDNQSYDLYQLDGVNTPTLVGLVATAPYLHDGRALTLRAVLETTRGAQMGDTSMLSTDELDDLEAYLRSL